jgi:hypothetical protein
MTHVRATSLYALQCEQLQWVLSGSRVLVSRSGGLLHRRHEYPVPACPKDRLTDVSAMPASVESLSAYYRSARVAERSLATAPAPVWVLTASTKYEVLDNHEYYGEHFVLP